MHRLPRWAYTRPLVGSFSFRPAGLALALFGHLLRTAVPCRVGPCCALVVRLLCACWYWMDHGPSVMISYLADVRAFPLPSYGSSQNNGASSASVAV